MSATREKLTERLEKIEQQLAAIDAMKNEGGHINPSANATEARLAEERDLLTAQLARMPPQDLKDSRVLRG